MKFKKPAHPPQTRETLAQWVEEFCMPLDVRRVYIAIIPNGETKWHYDLEIETIPRDTIGAVYTTDTFNVEKARGLADALAVELARHGFHVVHTRKEWERDVA